MFRDEDHQQYPPEQPDHLEGRPQTVVKRGTPVYLHQQRHAAVSGAHVH